MLENSDLDSFLDRPAEPGAGAPAPVDPAPTDKQQAERGLCAAVSMAMDVQWAWENMGKRRMTRKQAGSDARFALWQHAQTDRPNFVGQVAPKAMGILDKWADSQNDDAAIVKAERKGLDELKSILSAAIKEAEGLQV